MALIFWIVFTFLTMADIGKYHFFPSEMTVLMYGMVSFILGYTRARLLVD